MPKLPIPFHFPTHHPAKTEIFSFSNAMAYNSPTFAHPKISDFPEKISLKTKKHKVWLTK
jgi:hypothetical protein